MNADIAIKNRKTQKVLVDAPWPIEIDSEALASTINELLDLAAFAPYHRKCDEIYMQKEHLNSSVPWRAHVLDTKTCRQLIEVIDKHNIQTGKIKNMLSAADALIMMTWLPDVAEEIAERKMEALPFDGSLRNMEHIAATAAAIQNILIGATAREIPSYWSTGGQLRFLPLRDMLGISLEEVLLGALFLFPSDSASQPGKIIAGSLREEGKEKSSWSRWVQL